MNDITEKTNAQVAITLDDVEEGTPVSVFFFEQYGENKDSRIEVANYRAPTKGHPHAAIFDLNDSKFELGGKNRETYYIEIWSNIDSESQQLEHTDTVSIIDARAV